MKRTAAHLSRKKQKACGRPGGSAGSRFRGAAELRVRPAAATFGGEAPKRAVGQTIAGSASAFVAQHTTRPRMTCVPSPTFTELQRREQQRRKVHSLFRQSENVSLEFVCFVAVTLQFF
ncbi:hypothetical protein F2P81_002663 [Scophthalmus maximus]|uniref:Uncharacterized protein n=1 Tax=Scophthalmus maximus TaxID=52904 RepID=A0A6A4TSC3_SCOMX|nr:hypothetical protein F2P81_002663 [Scophthalmus maximus]